MWFLDKDIVDKIESALRSNFQLDSGVIENITAASKLNGKLQRAGKEANIVIDGVLTDKPDWIAAYFGGGNTTYSDIRQALSEANSDETIDSINLRFGWAPGGNVTGLFPAMDAIRDSAKPVTAYVQNGALSAAYGLASQAGTVIASDRSTMLGSVGVAVDAIVFDGDVKEISLSSTEAPKKRPDLLTDEGKAIVVEELDNIHTLFAESIAEGRKTTVDKVNSNFGRGAVVLAGEALKVGMIDSIGVSQSGNKKSATAAEGKTEVGFMDLKQLKTDHPAVYEAAVEVGRAEERDRVTAHIKMAEASGDTETAFRAIADGSRLTDSLLATYSAASMNRRLAVARAEDNVDVDVELDAQGGDSLDARVAKALEKLHSGDMEGVI